METQDLTQLSRGAALLLLLGGPAVLVLRGGGWFESLLYAVYILATLFLFDRGRERWRSRGRAAIWFDLIAAAAGLLFCAILLV